MVSKFIPLLLAMWFGAENPFKTIDEIPTPSGYYRIKDDPRSFEEWLGRLSLKRDKTVYKFDGRMKYNQSAQFAVIDMSVGTKDLQQCADAVMRLRAEFLYSRKKYNAISFIDNNYKRYQFTAPYTKDRLTSYLQLVFGMCGSASLEKQLTQRIRLDEIAPGDVIIRGGFPGHAVIVVDVAVNSRGKKVYMLAQSYMPAQDVHVLKNPVNGSPWYEVNDSDVIETPEYTFRRSEVRRW